MTGGLDGFVVSGVMQREADRACGDGRRQGGDCAEGVGGAVAARGAARAAGAAHRGQPHLVPGCRVSSEPLHAQVGVLQRLSPQHLRWTALCRTSFGTSGSPPKTSPAAHEVDVAMQNLFLHKWGSSKDFLRSA